MNPQPRQAHALLAAALLAAACGVPAHAQPAAEQPGLPQNTARTATATGTAALPAFMTNVSAAAAHRVSPGNLLLLAEATTQGARTPATLQAVHAAPQSDILRLDAGYRKSFLPGMVCRVRAKGSDETIARIIIVEARAEYSAALVLDLLPNAILRPGDTVLPKLLDL
ncbi:MAG: hypothetical protein LBV28_04420 [Puniceicoccales bacterium]|jgi:hypothetical protein|nr:hypothetical protein [Puniceicoccales bacterium]